MSEPLYAIVARYQDDLAKLQDLDIPAEVVLDTIEGMQGELVDKLRAVVGYAIDLEKQAEIRAAEAKRMADSAKRMAERAESIRTYAQIGLMNSGLKLPVVCPEFTLNLAKNPRSVEITDCDGIPDEYVKTCVTLEFQGRRKDWTDMVVGTLPEGGDFTVEVKPLKKPISDALKAGFLPGAVFGPQSYRLSVK